MKFFAALALVNIACFLPLYVLNFREQPNPFAFLGGSWRAAKPLLRLLYSRVRFTDPFRINFDFTFLVLIASTLRPLPGWAVAALGVVLWLSWIEIVYATVMQVIFKRAPSLASDLSLLRTGWTVAHNYRYLIATLLAALVLGMAALSIFAAQQLLAMPSISPGIAIAIATALLLPCFYHWQSYRYSSFVWRVVYSSTLHLLRNLRFSRRTQEILTRDEEFFASRNAFSQVEFEHRPTIVLVCIESYGSIAFADDLAHPVLSDRANESLRKLADAGYQVASSFSEAPIFAGGSWLSFSSLTYGTRFDDAYVHDSLFSINSSFGAYESLFHILERNGYSNNLLCPLGGVSSRYVNWDSLDRCFRPERKFDFDSLDYNGATYDFFVQNDLYAAPDQYALNYAYDTIRSAEDKPFSLFYCTLNSHYPWNDGPTFAEDWRTLGTSAPEVPGDTGSKDINANYARSIRYQLDYVLDFAARHADDDLLLVVFGDHQPPFITPKSSGKHTPIHVLSRNPQLVEEFLECGFAPTWSLANASIDPIRHEGFLSLLMRAMNRAFGTNPALPVEYSPAGTALLREN